MTSLDIHLAEYRPLNGSSYIKLLEFIKSKKAVLNVKNADNQCFKWCITRAPNPFEKNPQRITKLLRAKSEKLDWSGNNFPVELDKISRFAKQNGNIAVKVLSLSGAAKWLGYDEPLLAPAEGPALQALIFIH